MVVKIIQNPLNRQGTNRDVEANFSIKDAIRVKYTPNQLRSLVATESLPYKVAGYIPQIMGNVAFTSTLEGETGDFATEDLKWVDDQLKRLLPWLVQGQTKANICGKAYIIYEAERLTFDIPDETFVNQDVPVSPVNIGLEQLDEGSFQNLPNRENDPDPTRVNPARINIDPTLNAGFTQPQNTVRLTQDRLINYFPLLSEIDWRNQEIQRLTPFNVVSGDTYAWSSEQIPL